jgi:hypothetical protein
LFLVDEFFRPVSRDSLRAEEQLALEDAVNLHLPIVAYEMPEVSRDDLDSATLVSELGRRGHSAIGVDVEIWRLLRHYDLPMPTRLVETRREFFGFGALPRELKFTARGQVTMRVLRESSIDTRAILRFEVTDTGIGISPEARPHLFEAFSPGRCLHNAQIRWNRPRTRYLPTPCADYGRHYRRREHPGPWIQLFVLSTRAGTSRYKAGGRSQSRLIRYASANRGRSRDNRAVPSSTTRRLANPQRPKRDRSTGARRAPGRRL